MLACGVASCAMGIARRAVDELVELAGTKKPQGSSKTLGRRPQVQADVAIAEAKLEVRADVKEKVEDKRELREDRRDQRKRD